MTTTDIAVSGHDPLPIARRVFGDERIQVLKDIVAKGCTDAELEAFALVCQRTHLDPFARPPQIYAIKRYDSKLRREVLTPQASIDSFRLIAARTREYQGQDGPYWCGPDGVWKDLWLSDDPPAAAKVGVRRKGFKDPVWSVATWKESAKYFDGKLGQFWKDMPAHMLAKVAETDALKRAFPNDTEGLELTAIDGELREQQATMARRYDEIFGDDKAGSAYDLPSTTVLNADGAGVDQLTGEVLESEDTPAPPPQSKRKAAQRPPTDPITSVDDPLYQRYSQLHQEAVELGLKPEALDLSKGLMVSDLTKLGQALTGQIAIAQAQRDLQQRQQEDAEAF